MWQNIATEMRHFVASTIDLRRQNNKEVSQQKLVYRLCIHMILLFMAVVYVSVFAYSVYKTKFTLNKLKVKNLSKKY